MQTPWVHGVYEETFNVPWCCNRKPPERRHRKRKEESMYNDHTPTAEADVMTKEKSGISSLGTVRTFLREGT